MLWSDVKQSAAGLLGGAGDRHALLAWSRRGVLAAGAVLTLGACGFKLRQAPNFAFRTIYINPGAAASLANELRRSIATSDKVQVLMEPREMAGADVVLELLSSLQEKVVVAQNSSGQVQEFTLRMTVRFNLRTPAGKLLIADAELLQQRDVSYSESAALGKEAEESLLFRSMQSELVQQIMLRLAAVREL